jgi:SCP-2 sterol transfer family protein
LATKRNVEAKLRELIKRLEQANGDVRDSLAGNLPEAKVIEVVVPDLDAVYWTEMSGGRMSTLHTGVAERADIRVKVASDHLVELVDGKRSLFSSVVGGQVKVEASFSDLLRLRKMA